ncbi:MAG: T9SS type A sorting domain-containing protein [Bacteroidetes bacterium]|nr:T9SS type A sorting domain-containing protein [Bacteroidota bacterium]
MKSDVNWSKAVLMDATGKVLYTSTLQKKADHHSVNISHLQLSPGIYLLRLENDDRTGVQKLIKK